MTLLWSGTAIAGFLIAGCAVHSGRELNLAANYRPENVFSAPVLPPTVQRVAVLPMTVDEQQREFVEARAVLEPIVAAELAKTRRFELCTISPEFLRARTGRVGWSGEEPLPPNLLTGLREAFGCEAVLFTRLTAFRGYAPLAVGLRMRLVQVNTLETLWAIDEVVDAGKASVRSGARAYQLMALQTGAGCPDPWLITTSSHQFGQYAAAEMLTTLPRHMPRQKKVEFHRPEPFKLPKKSPKDMAADADIHMSGDQMNETACQHEKEPYGN